jgi:hypothetical protein
VSSRAARSGEVALLALVALACAVGCGKSRNRPRLSLPTASCTAAGVQPIVLRPTFGGAMLDFRLKVLDADKARPLFERRVKPYLVDRKSGEALGMPEDTKLGALRAGLRNPPIAGKLYFILFANGQGTVRRGSRVDVVLGDCSLRDLRVE